MEENAKPIGKRIRIITKSGKNQNEKHWYHAASLLHVISIDKETSAVEAAAVNGAQVGQQQIELIQTSLAYHDENMGGGSNT